MTIANLLRSWEKIQSDRFIGRTKKTQVMKMREKIENLKEDYLSQIVNENNNV